MFYTISFGFNTKSIKCVNKVYDKKKTNTGHFKTTVGYIFSKYVQCDMRFLVVNLLKRIALLSKRVRYCHSDI